MLLKCSICAEANSEHLWQSSERRTSYKVSEMACVCAVISQGSMKGLHREKLTSVPCCTTHNEAGRLQTAAALHYCLQKRILLELTLESHWVIMLCWQCYAGSSDMALMEDALYSHLYFLCLPLYSSVASESRQAAFPVFHLGLCSLDLHQSLTICLVRDVTFQQCPLYLNIRHCSGVSDPIGQLQLWS